jgi:hypothetical protein
VTDRRDVQVPHFGTVPVADGEIVVQDASVGGQGHTLRLADRRATWERRLNEGLQAKGSASRGNFVPSDDELRDLEHWADVAWELCARPKPPARPATHAPLWVWCVIVRRGNEARWLADGDHAPEELRPLLDWLRRRVDGQGGS